MRWLLIVALLATGCKSKSSSEANGAASSGQTSMSKFTLTEAGDDTNKVTVSLAVPSNWKTDDSHKAGPAWKMDGAFMLTLVTIGPSGPDAATRVAKAIKMQWSDLTGAARTDYPDGRVFISKTEGDNTNARMFVPYAGGVVMGVSMLDDPSKVSGVKAAFETLKIAQ